ncbi:MAG: conjugal transfer protein TraG N-terminal domain-containing protein, partial [Methylovulum sp.]|nr:conjugal transfer protein TraG N-terminal domain-containing protein [Methylovulum sp.]
PIVAFLTTLGLMGIKMIARYFQMLIWIALWGPITAVCNLYIAMVTTRIMTTISDQAEANGTSLMAMISHDQLYGTLETWLATGGMLASSVPALSLMLVYGGSVAATNLSGRMTAGTSAAVKPERLMPEPVSIAATTSIGSQRSMDSNSGQTVSGWSEGAYSMASGSQKSQQSAFTSLQSANASASQAFNNLTQHTDTKGHTVTDGTTITDSLSQSHSASDRWAAATGKAIAEKVGRTDAEKEAIAASASTQLALGASAGVFSALRLDGKLGLDSDSGISAERKNDISSEMDKTWRSEYANANETRSAHDYAKAHSDQSMFSSQDMKVKGENYMAQLARVDQAQQAYQESVTDSQTSGQNLTLKHSELARRLVQTGVNADLANVERDITMYGTDKEKANWQDAKKDAAKQLDAGAAQIPRTSKEYEAMRRFLALDEIDPQHAFHIASSTFQPTGNRLDIGVSDADDYKKDAKTPDDILGQQQADNFADRARGQASTGTAAANAMPRSAPQSGPNGKATGTNNHPMDISGGSNANAKQSVNGILNGGNLGDPDEIERRIKAGPLIKDGQDTSHLMGGAVKNEGGALYDNTVVAGGRSLDNLGKAIGGAVFDAEAYLKDVVGGGPENKPASKPQKREPFDELPDIKK